MVIIRLCDSVKIERSFKNMIQEWYNYSSFLWKILSKVAEISKILFNIFGTWVFLSKKCYNNKIL